jgi:hypothetical protein
MPARVPALIVAIGVVASTGAHEPRFVSTGQQTPPAPGNSLIVGRIVDGTTGAAVTGVAVTIGGAAAPATGNAVLVDSRGRFLFSGLLPGTYTLRAQKNGYIPGAFGRIRHDGQSQSIELGANDRRTDVVIRLWRYASISGRVVDEAGEPVADAYVRAFRRTWVAGRASLSASGGGFASDDRGMYRIGGLVPGEYVVGMPSRLVTYPIAFVEADAAARDAGGAAEQARSAELSARGSSMLEIFPAYPSARIGNFTIARADGPDTPLPTGSEPLTIFPITFHPSARTTEQATPVILTAGEERSGVDLHLTLTPTVAISGVASGPDGPIENLGLRLQLGPESQFWSRMLVEPAQTVSAANGAFTFLGVPPGSYSIVARMSRGSEGSISAALPVTVGDKGLANVALTLHPNARVSGRVEYDGSSARPASGLSGQILRLDPVDGHFERLTFQIAPDGTMSVTGVPPGRYFVRLENLVAGSAPSSRTWTLKSALFNGRDVSDLPLTVEGATEITGLVATFTDRAAGLTGTVRNSQNSIDATASILVFPTDRTLWVDYGSVPRRLRVVTTDRDGAYTVAGLPAGEYFAIAVPQENAEGWQRSAFLAQAAAVATRVTIGESGIVTVDLVTRRW